MLSQHYKHWLSIEDTRRCKHCEAMQGKVFEINERPNPEPPLHENCRCMITPMEAIYAGEATSRGQTGADWWLIRFQKLPPYYISKDTAKSLGRRSNRGNLSIVAPNRMLTKGIYRNDDGHLPTAEGRVWTEADINFVSGQRNSERILFSNDGLIFVTRDHYMTFIEIIDPNMMEDKSQ